MGEHDQSAIWHTHDEDAHASIHDDGRTLREGKLLYNSGYPVAVHEPGAQRVFVYRGQKLIPDTVYVHSDAFLVTEWESLYSSVFTLGGSNFSRASFAPTIDDSWRVVGHVGWADGNDILVPEDTVRNDRLFWSILQKARLGEWRQQILDTLDRGRATAPNFPFPPPAASPPPAPKDKKTWRGPENCVYRPHPSYKPTILEEARSGPLKEDEIHQYLHDLDKFVNGDGKAFVGRHFQKPGFASYLEPFPGAPDGEVGSPKKPFSSGYEFLVLVDPDGNLRGVMDIRKNLKTQHELDAEILVGLFDIVMTITMIIDIVPIAVVLYSLAGKMLTRATIWAIKLVADREAKALLKLAEQEAKRLAEAAAEKAARGFAVETVVIDAETEARWEARGARLHLDEPGDQTVAVGELWREGAAGPEKFRGVSGRKAAKLTEPKLPEPPKAKGPKPKVPEPKPTEVTPTEADPITHVMKPKPIEGYNKGIPDHFPDLSPAEKRKWLNSPDGRKWQQTQKLDGPNSPHPGAREHDAEAHMFKRLEELTKSDSVGEFHFMADHPMCPACKNLTFKFTNTRPRIRVIQHVPENKFTKLP